MLVLTVRTDSPEAELGLYDGQKQLAYHTWQAHRELSKVIHHQIEDLLRDKGKSWKDLQGIVAFSGPGSFTGLRIGLTVVNAIGYAEGIPVVAGGGESWIAQGIERLQKGDHDALALPEYGRGAHITTQKK
ncbi:MAG TPA: tRNA (adenosine(37)-N6)-threonylcarbamoyltransferase complex dimerization subunit type 1 TsaB [Candidatus Saccharimonadales bacterium]|nr:tRNA (adenosine(37)-N6)-threonylcarbamoyltransferase complex dimerization subunit type 1 TsaB [Candidatus Saccharimonadales bacterium]